MNEADGLGNATLDQQVSGRTGLVRRLVVSALRICLAVGGIVGVFVFLLVQPTFSSSPKAGICANPDLLREHVRSLTESFGPRYYERTENLAACRAYLIGKFSECGARTSEQSYRAEDFEFKNVRAIFGSEDSERIVIGAHYDACDEGAGTRPGADDNASGVAGLLELARLLQQKRPAGTAVELVAYCTEEPPYYAGKDMGSYRHAQLLRKENAKVRGVLVLEMIGFFTDSADSQRYPIPQMKGMYPSTGNFISLVGGVEDRSLIATAKSAMTGSTPLPVNSACIPRGFDFAHLSDHRNYWPFGYPAIMVTDTAFYRNSNYHKTTDTWQSLDYTRMAHAVTQVHQAVLKLGK